DVHNLNSRWCLWQPIGPTFLSFPLHRRASQLLRTVRPDGGSPPPLLNPKPTKVEATGILSEREDCTLVAWYPSLYAPFAGGAHDSHHRTAGIAGRIWRRGGGVAARGAGAAARSGAADWHPDALPEK